VSGHMLDDLGNLGAKLMLGKAHPDNALRGSGSIFRIGREMELELLEGVHAQVRRAASSSDGEYPQPVAKLISKVRSLLTAITAPDGFRSKDCRS
jgi:hypothetical protein